MEEAEKIEDSEDARPTKGEIQIAPDLRFDLKITLTNIQKVKQVELTVLKGEEDPFVAKLPVSAKDTKTEGFMKAQESDMNS